MNRLWYKTEAKNWNEALPIGNGFMGAMIFGKTNIEQIQLNEDSLWSGGPMQRDNLSAPEYLPEIRNLLDQGRLEQAEALAEKALYPSYIHMRHYQPLGDIWIDFFKQRKSVQVTPAQGSLLNVEHTGKEVKDYYRDLDLNGAVASVCYKQGEDQYKRTIFASNPDHVLVYHLEALKGELDFDLWATRKENTSGLGSSYCDGSKIENDILRLYGWQGGPDGIGFELACEIEIEGGTKKAIGSHFIVENAKSATIYITARTTYRSKDPAAWCQNTLGQAVKKGYEKILEDHIQDYRSLFDRSKLEFKADPDLDKLTTPQRLDLIRQGHSDPGLINTYYSFARYLLISCSRVGSLPANLQGIWNKDFSPAWGSKYTININIQMIYWLAENTGLSELHLPLMEHLKTMHPRGQATARNMYNCRGFVCHHNTDIWGDCSPQDNHVSSTIWPMGGAWLTLHLASHYEYTKDRDFLKAYYPILKDSVLFFMDYMTQDKSGHWVTGPSSSPENIYRNAQKETGCLCMGPAMDSQILYELFSRFLEIAPDLNEDKDFLEAVQKRRDSLYPITIGSHGQIQEWIEDYEEMDPGHRHISQLFALYPGRQIRIDKTPELAKAAAKTIERRLQNGGGHTGWSKAWILLFYDRLRNKKEAWANLMDLLGHLTLNNLFNDHPPFQIDGNFGGAAGILEMVVQDYKDTVALLPCLPGELSTGSLTGFRLMAGASLNMEWEDGKVSFWEIIPERDGQIILDLEKPIQLKLEKGKKITSTQL